MEAEKGDKEGGEERAEEREGEDNRDEGADVVDIEKAAATVDDGNEEQQNKGGEEETTNSDVNDDKNEGDKNEDDKNELNGVSEDVREVESNGIGGSEGGIDFLPDIGEMGNTGNEGAVTGPPPVIDNHEEDEGEVEGKEEEFGDKSTATTDSKEPEEGEGRDENEDDKTGEDVEDVKKENAEENEHVNGDEGEETTVTRNEEENGKGEEETDGGESKVVVQEGEGEEEDEDPDTFDSDKKKNVATTTHTEQNEEDEDPDLFNLSGLGDENNGAKSSAKSSGLDPLGGLTLGFTGSTKKEEASSTAPVVTFGTDSLFGEALGGDSNPLETVSLFSGAKKLNLAAGDASKSEEIDADLFNEQMFKF